jgi:hypothetical protein
MVTTKSFTPSNSPNHLLPTFFDGKSQIKFNTNSGNSKNRWGVPPCYPSYFENFLTSILGTKILSRKISESSEKLQYTLLIRNFRTFSEISRWEKFSRKINWTGKIHLKIEEVIASTPNRFNASLCCSREDSIPAFNFKGSIFSFGNSFSRCDRVVTKDSTIPLVKSFASTSPVN